MQDLRFYLLIEDEENNSKLKIDGNLEVFRDLLHALRADLTPVTSSLVEDPKQTKQEASCVRA